MATWFSSANEEDNHHISTSLNARASSILDWIPRAKSLFNRVTADPKRHVMYSRKKYLMLYITETSGIVYHRSIIYFIVAKNCNSNSITIRTLPLKKENVNWVLYLVLRFCMLYPIQSMENIVS